MLKKVLGVLLSANMLLAMPVCAAGEEWDGSDLEPLKIGMITQLTGPNSFGGYEYKQGAELALEHWGGKINGREIELVFADGPTQDAVVSEFERLYDDGVRYFISGYGCIADRSIAAMVDEMECMYLSLAWDADLLQGPSDYFFRGGANVTAFGRETMNAAIGLSEQYLGIPANELKVAMVYTTRLNHVADPIKAQAEEMGVEIVYDGGYPNETTEFTSIVTTLMNTEYDVLIPIQGAADGAPFQKKMAELNYTPPLTVAAGCYYDTPNFADLGDDITNGVMSLSYTTPSMAEDAAPGITKMSEDYEAKHGWKPLAHALQAYGGMEIYFKVLESVDPATWDDPKVVADAMKDFKADYGELVWYWGIDFDELNDNKKAEQYLINQWVGGELHCVYPDFLATSEAVVPWVD